MKGEKGDKNLDHMFSVRMGFELGILPQIIGSKCNLRLAGCTYNHSKQTKCSISKEELFLRYELYNKFMCDVNEYVVEIP